MMEYECFDFPPFGIDHQVSDLLKFLHCLDRLKTLNTDAFEHFLPFFFLREHVMSLKVFHFYMQMISSLEKLIFMKKELKIKLKKIKRIKETSCKKKKKKRYRGEVLNSDIQLPKRKAYHCIDQAITVCFE